MRRTAFVLTLSLVGLLFVSTGQADAHTTSAGDFIYVARKATVGPRKGGTAQAVCPQGTRTVGAGGAVGGSRARLTGATPVDLNSDMTEDEGVVTQAWNASRDQRTAVAVAICSKGPDIADLTYNRQTTSETTTAVLIGVACAGGSGMATLGGGAGTAANAFDHLSYSSPAPAHWGYGIAGMNPAARDLTGVVICLPATDRTITVVTKTVQFGVNVTKTVKVPCPPGTHVTDGGAGNAVFLISRTLPFDGPDRDTTPDDGWMVRLTNTGGSPNSTPVEAVCAGPAA